jgi:hypothetical protein
MRVSSRLFAAALLTSCVFAVPAKAAIHDLGVIGLGSTGFQFSTGAGSFTEYVKFQIATTVDASVSYSNTVRRASQAIVGGFLALNDCASNCTGTLLTPVSGGVVSGSPLINVTPTVQVAGFGPDTLNSGGYFLKLTGTAPGSVLYAGTLSVAAAVPEPGTWAMMLIGFAGLAFASSRRRSMAVATA